jgi:hypothetical protein
MNAVCTTLGCCAAAAAAAPNVEFGPIMLSATPLVLFNIPPSISGLLLTGGRIVAECGGVTSIGSALGDSEEVADGGGMGRFLCFPAESGPLVKGLRGGSILFIPVCKAIDCHSCSLYCTDIQDKGRSK